MNTLEQIEKAVTSLPEDQFRKLCDWVITLDRQKWDQQIVTDSEQGLLDESANRAFAEYCQGKTTRL